MDEHSRRSVERWLPSSWDEVVGNPELKEHLRDVLWSVRVKGDYSGNNTLVFGPSRSGKTATLKLFMRCLVCHHLDEDSLNPCNRECPPCRAGSEHFGEGGIFQQVHRVFFHCLPIDCTAITESELRERLADLRDFSGVRAVYLDEIHRLARRGMNEQLLKKTEERDFIWLASAISVKGLEEAFLNRFSTKIKTEAPSVEELAAWLEDRCRSLKLDWDDSHTMIRLAQRSNGMPGLALHAAPRIA
jgi:hypothetical protein